MEENNLFHERYLLERLLGRGSFSEVWLATDTLTDIKVALKIYAPATGLDDAGLNVFAREFSLVVNANHKNLLKPLYYDACDRKPYLVLPYCERGSIIKLVGSFTEEDAWRLLRDVASGLSWLHAMNPPIIHQDIKPDNIMVGDSGDFMITDFGVSTHLRSSLRKSMSSAFTSAGTIAYMAPERFSKDNTPIMANDIYSLGATVFEMITSDAPFGDDGGLLQQRGAEIPDIHGDYSNDLKKVITLCLHINPWERPTAEQLESYANMGLAHEKIQLVGEKTFIQKYKWVLGLVALLCVGGVVGLFSYSDMMEKKAHIKAMNAFNDSISVIIDNNVKLGKDELNIGDMHDEFYEDHYIEALTNFQKALENGLLMKEKEYSGIENIRSNIRNVKNKLTDSYDLLKEKAELFSEDPEIAKEFYQRMSKIQSAIDIVNNKD